MTVSGRYHQAARAKLLDRVRARRTALVRATAPALISEVDQCEVYSAARDLVIKHQNASTSWLQRTLRVSYSDANAVMQQLERHGLLTQKDSLGRRGVIPGASDKRPMSK